MATTLAPNAHTPTRSPAPSPSSRPTTAMPVPSTAPERDPLVVTVRDTDLLRLSADLLALTALDGYVRFCDIHTALYVAGEVLEPASSRAQLFASADHAVALLAEYLVTRRAVPAGPTAVATMRGWTPTVAPRQVVTALRAVAHYHQLRLVLTTHGYDGLLSYLRTGVWPG